MPRTFCEIRAPAKINLGLSVLGKRGDGFHEVFTTLVAVNLYDRLRFARLVTGGVRLHLQNPTVSTMGFPLGESNLIVRAIRLVEDTLGVSFDLSVSVEKTIPIAAGLGGGSADAAATLRALNRLYDLGADSVRLASWAAALGSDVPFFLGAPCAVGRGRGDIMCPVRMFTDWWVVLISPPVFLSAGEVYRQFNLTSPKGFSCFCSGSDRDGFFATLQTCRNDLEPVVIRRIPQLRYWLKTLKRMGAESVFVSGSGPTVFGVFRRRPSAGAMQRLYPGSTRVQVNVVRPIGTSQALMEC